MFAIPQVIKNTTVTAAINPSGFPVPVAIAADPIIGRAAADNPDVEGIINASTNRIGTIA